MKKIIIVFSFLVLLVSCGQSQSDVEAAKQKLLWEDIWATQKEKVITNPVKQEDAKEIEKKSAIQIVALSSDQFLEFDVISDAVLNTWEVKISGKTLSWVDKIEVLFSNPTSSYPDDNYELQTFKSGWDSFRYVASSRNQVLDFDENTYIFTAYAWEKKSQTKVVIVLVDPEKKEEKIGTESQLIGTEENTLRIDLPTSSKYGEPMMLGEASFTYTQIKGLEIEKEVISQLSCDTLTDFLTKRMKSWYYWNTCREIIKEKWIKFNLIRLEWDKYVYERHYVDFIHWFYWTYELETWEWVNSENIADKNSELKIQEFPSLEIIDDLMKDIVNS